MSLFLEDYHPGDTAHYGSHTFTAAAITEFARVYDPQPFHVDAVAAQRSVFAGLCASGWHTAAIWMRLMVQRELAALAAMTAAGQPVARMGPSPGFTDMRFLRPVRPGDTLTYSGTVTGIEPWRGRPTWGLMASHNEAHNQHGQKVFEFNVKVLVERRVPLP